MDAACDDLAVSDEKLRTVWPERVVAHTDTGDAPVDGLDWDLDLGGNEFALIGGRGNGVHGTKGAEDREGWFASDHFLGGEWGGLFVGDTIGDVGDVCSELELVLGWENIIQGGESCSCTVGNGLVVALEQSCVIEWNGEDEGDSH